MSYALEDVAYLILDSYDHFWARDLVRIARVSSAFLQPARKHLYRSPLLYSYRACHLLARSLSENQDLISIIHALDIRPSHDRYLLNRSRDNGNEHLPGICPGVSRLLALVRVEMLTLSGDLAYGAQRFLRGISFPHTITTLQIRSYPQAGSQLDDILSPSATIEWDGELATRFSALKCLYIIGPFVLEIDDSHFGCDSVMEGCSSAISGCRLEELCLANVEFSDASGVLPALLCSPASWNCLRTFSFTQTNELSEVTSGRLLDLFELSFDSLQNVCIDLSSHKVPGDITNFVKLQANPKISYTLIHRNRHGV